MVALVIALSFILGSAMLTVTPVHIPHAVEALRLVENWDGKTSGAAGEWGPWQILPSVWLQFSKEGQRTATPLEHLRVATAYVNWIVRNLHRINRPQTMESIALVYGAGYTNVGLRRITPAKQDYANRAVNLYEELQK